MDNLLPPNESILGCQINIPDQILVEKAKALRILKTERDGCIVEVNRNKTHLMDVLRYFLSVAIERKRFAQTEQQAPADFSLTEPDSKNGGTPHTKTVSVEDTLYEGLGSIADDSPIKRSITKSSITKLCKSPVTRPEKRGRMKKNLEEDPLISQFYKDSILIRYNQGFEQILSETDFNQEINGNVYRANHPYWQTINCVMLTPQNKIGLGKHFKFTFTPMCIEKDIGK